MEKNIEEKNNNTFVAVLGIIFLLVMGYIIVNAMTNDEPITTINQENVDVTPSANNNVIEENTTRNDTVDDSGVAFTIDVADLTAEQQTMLRAAGLNQSQIVVTNKMKTCAEERLGAERVNAFSRGEKPTVGEWSTLLICYNQDK